MRGATECAKRLKTLISQLRAKLGQAPAPQPGDPVTQLILGILSRDTPESKAQDGLERLRGMVVDYNELRVIPALELTEVLSDFPDARFKCEDISRALNKIFAIEHAVDLEPLHALNKRDLLEYLEKIDGTEAYSRARVRLLGLRQHAIPLDEAMWAYARHHEIVATRCDLHEAQQFLERQIDPDAGLEVFALLRKQAWEEFGDAVHNQNTEDEDGPVRRILSIPPDRTTRHMLQAAAGIASGRDSNEDNESTAQSPAESKDTTSPPASQQRSRQRTTTSRKKASSTRSNTAKTKRAAATKSKKAAKRPTRKRASTKKASSTTRKSRAAGTTKRAKPSARKKTTRKTAAKRTKRKTRSS